MRHRLLLFGDTPGGFAGAGTPLLTSLVAYYDLANVNDASGNGNTLTNNGTVTFGAGGKPGNCATINSALATQNLSAPTSASLLGADVDLTLIAWWNPSNLSDAAIVGKFLTTGNQREYLLSYEGSRFRFAVSGNGTATTAVVGNTFGAASLATWYMAVGRHDAAANTIAITVYAATAPTGSADSAAHTTGIFGGTADFRISGLSGLTYGSRGQIDSVGLWRGKRLSDAELLWLYNAGSGRDYAAVAAYTG
jgi:hypothetical protein